MYKMATKALLFLFVNLVVFVYDKMHVAAMYMPTILWDPRNPLFNCPSRGVNTIQVRMKDYLHFQCPSSTSNLGIQNSQLNYFDYYENAYFVYGQKKQDALNCNVTGYSHFMKCDKPQEGFGMGIRVASFSGNDHAPLFHYGKSYYIIGTGTGKNTGVNNKVGGRCNNVETYPDPTYKMIIKIKVCTREEELVYKNCTVCKTVGCYNKGCGLYNDWQEWKYFHNISMLSAKSANSVYQNSVTNYSKETNCFRKRQRSCQDEVNGCDGPSEQTEDIPCPKANLSPVYDNCTEWANEPNVDLKLPGLIRKHRNCTVGNIERMTVTQWRIEKSSNTSLPPKSAALKGLKNGNITISIQVFIVCLVAPLLSLAIGVVIGYFCTRRRKKKMCTAYIPAEMPRLISHT